MRPFWPGQLVPRRASTLKPWFCLGSFNHLWLEKLPKWGPGTIWPARPFLHTHSWNPCFIFRPSLLQFYFQNNSQITEVNGQETETDTRINGRETKINSRIIYLNSRIIEQNVQITETNDRLIKSNCWNKNNGWVLEQNSRTKEINCRIQGFGSRITDHEGRKFLFK